MKRQKLLFIAAVARTALVSAFVLATLQAARAADSLIPVTVDANFSVADAAAKGFTISQTQALKGLKRIAVPVFTVEFAIADAVSSQTSGFASAGRARSALYYKLLGVGEPDFQAMTNALHTSFLAELESAGFEVVPLEQITASSGYRKLLAGATPAPIKSDNAMVMSPPNLGIYGFTKAAAASSSKSVFGALSSMGAGFSAMGTITDSLELSKELNAGLLEIRMKVNFVQLNAGGKGFLDRLSGVASTSGKAFPSIDGMSVGVINNNTYNNITMRNSLTLDGSAFADVREKATTAGDVAGTVAVSLLKLAIGSSDSSSSTELEVFADPAKYKQIVGAGLSAAGAMLVARLKSER